MNLTNIEQDFIVFLSKAGSNQGMDPLTIKLFALIYIDPEDIAIDELAKRTGYSLASISNKVKILQTLGIIRKIKKPGSKKLFVRIEKNVLKIHRDIMIIKEAIGTKIAKELLPELLMKYKNKKLNNEEKKKLKIIEEYHKQIIILENLVKKTIMDYNKALKEYEKQKDGRKK